MLDFWIKDFDQSINKHINFLKDNIENQNIYSSKFSEILKKMDIFQSDNDEENEKENQNEGQNNPSEESSKSDSDDQKDQNKLIVKELTL